MNYLLDTNICIYFLKGRFGFVDKTGIGHPEERLYITGSNKLSSSQDNEGYQYIFDKSNASLYTSLGFKYERKSIFVMAALGGSLIISLAFVLISQLIMVIGTIMTFVNNKNSATRTQTLLELSASTLLIGIGAFLLCGSLENIHEPNVTSVTLFFTTLIFPILTIIGTAYLIKGKFKNSSVLGKTYLLGLTTSLIFMTSYLYYWDLLAFRIWSY